MKRADDAPVPGREFRRYPTQSAKQEFADEREVCSHCLSGACCTSEDPIQISSFDILRLATFLDLTPAEFLVRFTQDRFGGGEDPSARRTWIDDPASSTVTFLRRRDNHPTSACIFLAYTTDSDGTPRRVCSVHDARPLSCREFYFEHCKRRVTGELAATLAEGYEAIRDGEIDARRVDAELARLAGPDPDALPLSKLYEYAFWAEMRRALAARAANAEGCRSYPARAYQDGLDAKLDRLLSKPLVRYEEKYGAVPRDEQLMPYTAGRGLAGRRERSRLLSIVDEVPRRGLFVGAHFPRYVGRRELLASARPARVFPFVSAQCKRASARDVGPEASAVLVRVVEHLIALAARVALVPDLVELAPPAAFEREFVLRLERARLITRTPVALLRAFEPVRRHFERAIRTLHPTRTRVERPRPATTWARFTRALARADDATLRIELATAALSELADARGAPAAAQRAARNVLARLRRVGFDRASLASCALPASAAFGAAWLCVMRSAAELELEMADLRARLTSEIGADGGFGSDPRAPALPVSQADYWMSDLRSTWDGLTILLAGAPTKTRDRRR